MNQKENYKEKMQAVKAFKARQTLWILGFTSDVEDLNIIKRLSKFKDKHDLGDSIIYEDEAVGAELIALERREQIYKHGWDLSHDQDYDKGQLLDAALFCIDQNEFKWPANWDVEFEEKIIKKKRIEQLVVAGAFIAAEIDRLKRIDDEQL